MTSAYPAFEPVALSLRPDLYVLTIVLSADALYLLSAIILSFQRYLQLEILILQLRF